jgi:hypothetical protein
VAGKAQRAKAEKLRALHAAGVLMHLRPHHDRQPMTAVATRQHPWSPLHAGRYRPAVAKTRCGKSVICKHRVWPATDRSWPAGAARHGHYPLARLSHRSTAGLALHKLVDAEELDGPG